MKLKYIILLALSIAFLSSCSDSLGTDPNVRKTLIDDIVPAELIIKNDVEWTIKETHVSEGVATKIPWGNDFEYLANQVIIDTSGNLPKVTINLETEALISDYFLKKSSFRIQSARIRIDSAEINEEFIADKKLRDGKWADVRVEALRTNHEQTYQSGYKITSLMIIEQVAPKKFIVEFFSQVTFTELNEFIRLEISSEIDYN